MSHNEAVAAAGEAPVCNKCDFIAQAAAGDGARGREHLAHARTAARAFVADDDDVARAHPAAEDRLRGAFLTLEDARTTFEALAFFARQLRHRPLGGEIA